MKKNATKKEQERKEMEDVVTQDNLREMRSRRPQRLPDVFIRPGMDGKRLPGELEIHENGLRYQSLRQDQRVDVLFSNVKHLFFQPCAHELIVLIHVHLRDPIMIGKKKTKDVQFYREATDIQFDETGNRKRKYRYGDEEEFEQEQEERRRRAELDKEFKAFAEKISEAAKKIEAGVDVDVPYRELGFSGVPFRANVLCSPTTDALVSLTDMPFLVITLDEIEIAHLERVQVCLFPDDNVQLLCADVISAVRIEKFRSRFCIQRVYQARDSYQLHSDGVIGECQGVAGFFQHSLLRGSSQLELANHHEDCYPGS